MGKNLVLCCDGTNNEFGEENTNVVRIFSLALKCPDTQLAFYDPGVGTFSSSAALTPAAKWVTKRLGSAFGYGVSRNIADAYEFLIDHHAPHDRIFLFGFSRGAYTVRALAALIHSCGLLRPAHRNLVSYAIELLKSESRALSRDRQTGRLLPVCEDFRKEFSSRPPIHFLGLWDTVTSVGSVYNPLKLPFTTKNPSVLKVRHAVSIDERRKFFRQNLWSPSPQQDVRQVWFAGAHADVGGGYPEAESGLAKVTLQWMLEHARAEGLAVEERRLSEILPPAGSKPPPAPADSTAQIHNELGKFGWKLGQLVPRRVAKRRHGSTDEFIDSWRLSPLPQDRYIPEGSLIHSSVLERLDVDPAYRPQNLPNRAFDETGRRITFAKNGTFDIDDAEAPA